MHTRFTKFRFFLVMLLVIFLIMLGMLQLPKLLSREFLGMNHLPQTTLQTRLQKNIESKLDQSELESTVHLAELAPFDWRKVCLFGGYSSIDSINQTLGKKWLHKAPTWIPFLQSYWVNETATLLVFLDRQTVITYAEIPNRLITAKTASCFTLDQDLEKGLFTVSETEVGSGHKTLLHQTSTNANILTEEYASSNPEYSLRYPSDWKIDSSDAILTPDKQSASLKISREGITFQITAYTTESSPLKFPTICQFPDSNYRGNLILRDDYTEVKSNGNIYRITPDLPITGGQERYRTVCFKKENEEQFSNKIGPLHIDYSSSKDFSDKDIETLNEILRSFKLKSLNST